MKNLTKNLLLLIVIFPVIILLSSIFAEKSSAEIPPCGDNLSCSASTVGESCNSDQAKCLSEKGFGGAEKVNGKSVVCCNADRYIFVNGVCTLNTKGSFTTPSCTEPPTPTLVPCVQNGGVCIGLYPCNSGDVPSSLSCGGSGVCCVAPTPTPPSCAFACGTSVCNTCPDGTRICGTTDLSTCPRPSATATPTPTPAPVARLVWQQIVVCASTPTPTKAPTKATGINQNACGQCLRQVSASNQSSCNSVCQTPTPTPTRTPTSALTPAPQTASPSSCNPACKSNETCELSSYNVGGIAIYSCSPNSATPIPTPTPTPTLESSNCTVQGLTIPPDTTYECKSSCNYPWREAGWANTSCDNNLSKNKCCYIEGPTPTPPPIEAYTSTSTSIPTPTLTSAPVNNITLVLVLNAQDAPLAPGDLSASLDLYNLTTNLRVTTGASPSQQFAKTPIPGRQYSANISLANLHQDNRYFIVARKTNMIAKSVFTVSSANETITVPIATLVFGDINGDNDISILDYSAKGTLIDCYKKSITSSPACGSSDFDNSGIVDQIDYNTWLRGLATWQKQGQNL